MGSHGDKNEIDGRNSRKNRDKSGIKRSRRCSSIAIDRTWYEYRCCYYYIGILWIFTSIYSLTLAYQKFTLSFTNLWHLFLRTLWLVILFLKHLFLYSGFVCLFIFYIIMLLVIFIWYSSPDLFEILLLGFLFWSVSTTFVSLKFFYDSLAIFFLLSKFVPYPNQFSFNTEL